MSGKNVLSVYNPYTGPTGLRRPAVSLSVAISPAFRANNSACGNYSTLRKVYSRGTQTRPYGVPPGGLYRTILYYNTITFSFLFLVEGHCYPKLQKS